MNDSTTLPQVTDVVVIGGRQAGKTSVALQHARGQSPVLAHIDELPFIKEGVKSGKGSNRTRLKSIRRQLDQLTALPGPTELVEPEAPVNLQPTALAVIINQHITAMQLEHPEKRTPASPKELNATEQFLAGEIMRDPLVWEVLDELYTDGLVKIDKTRNVVMPIFENEETLREKLSDPDSFFRSFNTITQDIAQWSDRLVTERAKHAGRSGMPQAEDLTLTSELTLSYSELHNEFDLAINGGLQALYKTVLTEVPELVESEGAAQ